jgi:hypothetical protein
MARHRRRPSRDQAGRTWVPCPRVILGMCRSIGSVGTTAPRPPCGLTIRRPRGSSFRLNLCQVAAPAGAGKHHPTHLQSHTLSCSNASCRSMPGVGLVQETASGHAQLFLGFREAEGVARSC